MLSLINDQICKATDKLSVMENQLCATMGVDIHMALLLGAYMFLYVGFCFLTLKIRSNLSLERTNILLN